MSKAQGAAAGWRRARSPQCHLQGLQRKPELRTHPVPAAPRVPSQAPPASSAPASFAQPTVQRCVPGPRRLPPQQAKSPRCSPGREMPPVPSGVGLEQENPRVAFPSCWPTPGGKSWWEGVVCPSARPGGCQQRGCGFVSLWPCGSVALGRPGLIEGLVGGGVSVGTGCWRLTGVLTALSRTIERGLFGVTGVVGSVVRGVCSLCPASMLKKEKIRLGKARLPRYCIAGAGRSSVVQLGKAASRCSNFSSFQRRAPRKSREERKCLRFEALEVLPVCCDKPSKETLSALLFFLRLPSGSVPPGPGS